MSTGCQIMAEDSNASPEAAFGEQSDDQEIFGIDLVPVLAASAIEEA